MKKILLLICIVLCIKIIACGQGGMLPYPGTPHSTFDTDSQAFFTNCAITDATQKNAVDGLVVALKAANLWTKMAAIYPFVGGTAATHKCNLKDPRDLDAAFRLVFSGTITHDANGMTGDGSTGFADTKLIPSTVLSANDNHIAVYSRTNSIQSGYEIGANNAGASVWIVLSCLQSGNRTDSIIGATGTDIFASNANGSGLFVSTRRSATDFQVFRNSAISLGTSAAGSGSSLPANSIYIGARNQSGSGALNPSNKNIAFASIGSGLTSTDDTNLYTAVQNFETALSRNV